LRSKSFGAELVANFILLFLCVMVVKSRNKKPAELCVSAGL
jgi:hypothetical protein